MFRPVQPFPHTHVTRMCKTAEPFEMLLVGQSWRGPKETCIRRPVQISPRARTLLRGHVMGLSKGVCVRRGSDAALCQITSNTCLACSAAAYQQRGGLFNLLWFLIYLFIYF